MSEKIWSLKFIFVFVFFVFCFLRSCYCCWFFCVYLLICFFLFSNWFQIFLMPLQLLFCCFVFRIQNKKQKMK